MRYTFAPGKELGGIGCADPEAIEVIGDLSPYTKKYPFYLYPSFPPPDVKVIKGSERCCPEGCQNNTLTTLQFLYHDHGGKGGFTILMGKGFDPDVLNEISGLILLSGKCAIEETRAFSMSGEAEIGFIFLRTATIWPQRSRLLPN